MASASECSVRAGWPESFETLLVSCLALMFRVPRLLRTSWLARELRDAPRGLSGSGYGFRDCSARAGWPESFETLLVGCLALVFKTKGVLTQKLSTGQFSLGNVKCRLCNRGLEI